MSVELSAQELAGLVSVEQDADSGVRWRLWLKPAVPPLRQAPGLQPRHRPEWPAFASAGAEKEPQQAETCVRTRMRPLYSMYPQLAESVHEETYP
jgi:hypothetical protein